MKKRVKPLWAFFFALISGTYETVAFIGMPDLGNVYIRVAAALVLIGSLYRIFSVMHKELDEYRNPRFTFGIEPKEKLQRDQTLHANYARIAVTNNNPDVAAKACRLVIDDWTLDIPSLNEDTALFVKDENTMSTTIPPLDTKHFNLFYTALMWDTDSTQGNGVLAVNNPVISSEPGGYSMNLRLTGDNVDTRFYRALIIIDSQRIIHISRVDEIDQLSIS